MGKMRSSIFGPKWMCLEQFLRNEAFVRGLTLSLEISKGLVTETIRYEVSGANDRVMDFYSSIQKMIKDQG